MESRTPPHNLEAEQSVLGSILLDNEVFANLEGTLHAEQFYKEAHRKVFRAMEKLHRRGEPLDLVTLSEELRVAGDLEGVGSVAYLVGLVDMVPTAAYAESYARIVQEKATLRDLIGAGGRIMQTAYDQSGPLEEVLDQAEKAIFDLTTRKRRTNFEGMRTLVTETFQDINERFANPNPVSGLRAGFRDLDGLTGGLQPASLNVLAARPSMGKTAFALTIGLNAALKEAASVGIFSLEMSAVQLVTRMLCAEARVDMSRVRSGQLSDRDFQRLADTAGRMSEARVFIDDHADMTVMELRSRARRLQAEHGLDLLIIDYLQLMSGSSRSQSENRQQEISAISRGLKGLARELDVPVLVLSQLSRAVEARPNKRPMLSDLRECVGGDTLVDLADGRRMPIADLVGLQPELFAVDERGKVVTAKSDKVWPVGEKELFEVRLASGRVRRTTARHLWYSFDGWKRLEQLGPRDRVAIARRLPEVEPSATMADAAVALLGQLVGDGSYLKGQPLRFTTAHEANEATVREGAALFGCGVRRYAGRGKWWQLLISGNGDRWHPAGVGAWLKELGIFGQRSREKRLPELVFALPRSQQALLLRHLWATDGCIHVRDRGQKGSHRVFFSTSSRLLAEDVAALLLRLDIVAAIREPSGTRGAWSVEVSGAEQQRRFLRDVGAHGPREEQAKRLAEALAGVHENPNRDTIPRQVFDRVRASALAAGVSTRELAAARGTSYGGTSHFRFSPSRATLSSYAPVLGDDALAAVADSDLYWDEIVSVRSVGMHQAYDLTVPGPASWLADGVVMHNSGAIEQDADLVMFIYRDEYYDPHSEKHGIAEIIIGKQRNGPTGSLELQFHNAHVRFNDLAKGGHG
ncbi:MAG: replicative DNA helicase [Trueperaceae bacterium]|nr:replicative DNA helicase [Trueperaceae bacterium]